jgi:hypothetical protein
VTTYIDDVQRSYTIVEQLDLVDVQNSGSACSRSDAILFLSGHVRKGNYNGHGFCLSQNGHKDATDFCQSTLLNDISIVF